MCRKIIIAIITAIFILSDIAYANDLSAFDDSKSSLTSGIARIVGNDFDYDELLDALMSGNFAKAVFLVAREIKNKFFIMINNHNNIMSTIFAIACSAALISLCERKETTDCCSILLCACASVALLRLYYNLFILATHTLTSVFSVIRISLPLFIGISAAGGRISATAVDGIFVGFSVIFGRICAFLMPLVTIAAGLAVVGSFGIDCEHFNGAVLTVINWVLGICGVFFTALLKLTTVGAANFDFAALGGVKFALSHGIPIIGGFVSDSASAFISAALVIKSSLGLLTAAVIVILCIAPCIYILAVSFLLRLMSAACSFFGGNAPCKLVKNVGLCISELGIILLAVCISFVIGIAVILSSFGV